MTDQELINGCLKNDELVQKKLYGKFSRQMYGICLRYCRVESIAAEALQTGFIRVFKSLSNFRNEGDLGAWIRRIIIRAVVDQLKKEKISFTEDLSLVDESNFSYNTVHTFDDYDYNYLLNLINKMPDGYKMVFSMYVIDEMDHAEISEFLGISEATSRTQLFKARKMLQKLIAEYLPSSFDKFKKNAQ
jgi:RNA polymerase sigma factor (sigma-70 family)